MVLLRWQSYNRSVSFRLQKKKKSKVNFENKTRRFSFHSLDDFYFIFAPCGNSLRKVNADIKLDEFRKLQFCGQNDPVIKYIYIYLYILSIPTITREYIISFAGKSISLYIFCNELSPFKRAFIAFFRYAHSVP